MVRHWTQSIVLAFLAVVWALAMGVLALSPGVYDSSLRQLPIDHDVVRPLFAAGLTAFVLVLVAGVALRRRWLFWLCVIAFLTGALRVPASLLQIAGRLPAVEPAWYLLLQAAIGVVQLAVGVALLVEGRRSGAWGGGR